MTPLSAVGAADGQKVGEWLLRSNDESGDGMAVPCPLADDHISKLEHGYRWDIRLEKVLSYNNSFTSLAGHP